LNGKAALVVRPDYEVLVVRLEEADHAFAAALAEGATLGEAAAKGAEVGGFDLAPALTKLIAADAFCSFTLSPSEPGGPASCIV
jgi:hypothetical protein